MPSTESERSKSLKNGITMTRDFEIVEMSDMTESNRRSAAAPFATTTAYAVSTKPPADAGDENIPQRVMDSFKRAPGAKLADQKGYHVQDHMPDVERERERHYDVRVANARTASTGLSRELKGRHLQMIAIGGSIGTGLFVASGIALFQSGPASMILAYLFVGGIQFCIMQSLGELCVAFPIAGSFSVFSTRFLDPSWGFAMGWNYAFQWLFALPLEIIAGALTIQYWNDQLSKAIFVTIFLVLIAVINLVGIKGYGEAEFILSTVKVTAIVGFI
ncbi:hypothetical protein NLG97_g3329 [Lecanicillium saksenae]|uniref:Uncharacterized protein n=1 Tax=Lecanicillium saksenae TaxID=468837 RepID=A0ACC1R2E1_9HYPO|nr:hypothetical protein NLG97_g3329 [Lecanicillium saksenae]